MKRAMQWYGTRFLGRVHTIGEAGGYSGTASSKTVRLTDMTWDAGPFDRGTAAAQSAFLTGEPMVQAPGTDSVGLVWPVKKRSTGSVRFSERADFSHAAVQHLARSGQILWNDGVQAVRLTGLKPDTRYYYRTETRSNTTDAEAGVLHSFRTAGTEASKGGIAFGVLNDLGGHPGQTEKAMQALARQKLSLVVWNGNMSGSPEDRKTAVGNLLFPVRNGEAASVPVLCVPGPKDSLGAWAEQLSGVMLPRSDGERDIRYEALNYNFAVRYGNTALIGLDAGETAEDEATDPVADFGVYRGLQTDWLRGVLKRPDIATAKQIVVFCSCPLNGSGHWQKAWGALLTEAKVSAVISSDASKASAETRPAVGRSWLQLVGAGGARATVLSGRTDDAGRLTLTLKETDSGRVIAEVSAEARV